MHDLDNHFGSYNHLQYLPRAAEALHTLRKAASCVKPLMRKRGWRVGILSEFLPEQPNLLGLNTNRGEHIQLRLRHPGDTNQFLPFEQVLDTLLHELCHNVWGPHDQNFHNLWNELRDEWEVLQMKGFSGEGFLGKGQTLGGSRIPVEEVRRKARVAAQERAKLYKNNDSGRRLGGGNAAPPSRRRLRDILAGAAQSRNKANVKVDSGCATGTAVGTKAAEDALSNGFRTQAEMDDANSIAIAQALQELYEQEEDNRIYDGLSGPAPTDGLTWDPQQGLQPASNPSSRSTTPKPPQNQTTPAQIFPQPRAVSGASSTYTNGYGSSNGADTEYNNHGNPVSRLVREAEARKGRPQNQVPQSPTPAYQNWPNGDTGASLFGSNSRSGSQQRPISIGSNDDLYGHPTYTNGSGSGEGDLGDGLSWECLQCTFHNNDLMDKCEICDAPRVERHPTQRPSQQSNSVEHPALRGQPNVGGQSRRPPNVRQNSNKPFPRPPANEGPIGWLCTTCGTYMEAQWWTCSQCGRMKESS